MNRLIVCFAVSFLLLNIQRVFGDDTKSTTNAPVASKTIGPDSLFNIVKLHQINELDDDEYTNILSKWVDQGRIKALDVNTILYLKEATPSITDTNLMELERILNSLISSKNIALNAHVDFVAATTNFTFSLTNQPIEKTNLNGLFSDEMQLISNLTVPQGSPDSDTYNSLTNNWGKIFKAEPPYALQKKKPSLPYFAFFSSGAQFLNPYVVSVPKSTPNGTGTLTNTGNSTVAYLEFDWIYRYVLRTYDSPYTDPLLYTNYPALTRIFGGNLVNPFKTNPDLVFNMGFLLGNGSNLTNNSYSAQAVAGSDFYTSFTCGFPIWRAEGGETFRQQVSIELTGGVTTEESFEIVHPNAFAGVGYEASFNPFIGTVKTNQCGFFVARFGRGWVDVPSLTGTNNEVHLDNNGVPLFHETSAMECSAFLAYPLTSVVYLTVDANALFNYSEPNSWTIKVGASIPLDKVSGIIRGAVN